MKHSICIILLFLSTMLCGEELIREHRIEKDGFEWYLVRTTDWKYGAEDRNHKFLIHAEYDFVYYSCMAVCGFKVKKHRYVGFYSPQGKPILSISRRYQGTIYSYRVEDDTDNTNYSFFEIETPKRTIICNAKGKEILQTYRWQSISPRITHGHYYYIVQNVFDKYGVMDGHGNVIVQSECCSPIINSDNVLKTKDCITEEYREIMLIDSIPMIKNPLKL